MSEHTKQVLKTVFQFCVFIVALIMFFWTCKWALETNWLCEEKGTLKQTYIPLEDRYDEYCYFSSETKSEVCEYTKYDGSEKYRCYFNKNGGRQCDLIEESQGE